MSEFVVKTEQGRNITYMAPNKAEAERLAFIKGHCVKQVFTLDEYEREQALMLLEWRYVQNKSIEEESA